jgi:hypothetical protein
MRFFCCALATVGSVFTQPGSLASLPRRGRVRFAPTATLAADLFRALVHERYQHDRRENGDVDGETDPDHVVVFPPT